ncbi:MAG TPA: glycosyltransferase family 4 protein [Bosea sp. (in: a-proteobacteria)]|jgi:glycosyltransferase involved in cell wall biosynthesis|uniref:glycosyltransferase family 4 protein n=1 Tax=Bosea sp. (in: a-proteobacteria) TaxID=1871050 RepID=UPI002E1625EC|nr:glycosyltransferase family 4 protein [Bosea sp. (in: a-proteobacteria)]
MRVVIVSDFGAVNGGAAKVAIESARGLAEAGVDVVFACAIGPVSDRLDHPRIEVARYQGEEVWQVGSKIAAARQGIWNAAAHDFLTALLAEQPRGDTLVHLHQWTKAFSPAAIAAAGASGLPVAITMHDYFSFCPTGAYFDFKTGAPCQQTPMSVGCVTANCDRASYVHKLVRVARQWRSDEAMRGLKAPLFIHVSEFARRFAEPFLPKSARHVVVENMMEAPRREPVDVASNRYAVFVGRLTQEKGVLVLAQAARDAGLALRFVGDGDDELKAAVLRVNPDAQITGWLASDAVLAELRGARCLVAPSLWYETGPLTVGEAMAQGVPPIVPRTIGAASRVRDGIDGLVVPAVEPQALAEALSALRDGAFAARLGRAAHQAYWMEPPTLRRHVEALLGSYGGALAAAA